MKTIFYSGVILLMVLLNSSQAACSTDGDITTPFGKGTWLVNLNKPLKWDIYKESYDGSDYKYSDFRANLEAGYFFENNMGVTLRLNLSRSVADEYYKDISGTGTVSIGYLQGLNLGGTFFLAGGSVGYGRYKDVIKSIDQKQTSGIISLRGEFGPVLPLFNNSDFFFYPTIGVMYSTEKYNDNFKENTTNAFVRASLVFNFNCDDMVSDCEDNFEHAHERFLKGVNAVSASTSADIKIGGYSDSYGGGSDSKYSTNKQSLKLNVKRYVIDDLAVNLWTRINRYHEKAKDNSTDYSSSTDFIIGTGLTYHPPLGKGLENLFVEADFGVGKNKDTAYDETDYKENVIGGMVSVGYDWGLSQNYSLIPSVSYKNYKYSNTDGNDHYNDHGIVISIGVQRDF
jgi:hypothetical protein